MIPNPILRVLSTLQKNQVRFLLMGGQACILYGAAEFSRDMDVAVLSSSDNLDRLKRATEELDAKVIAVPPFEEAYLQRGHAVHFRCPDPIDDGVRLDVMSRMRGVEEFEILWERRTVAVLRDGTEIPVLSLPDLIAAKKTQRDKDWPMIRRLVEVNYRTFHTEPTPERIRFWLNEMRSPELLVDVVKQFPEEASAAAMERPAIASAIGGDVEAIQTALDEEVARERALDREYWAPLRKELEQLRRDRSRG